MAHLVSLKRSCSRCSKNATCEVFNSHNASQGAFCAKCGKAELAEIRRLEGTP